MMERFKFHRIAKKGGINVDRELIYNSSRDPAGILMAGLESKILSPEDRPLIYACDDDERPMLPELTYVN